MDENELEVHFQKDDDYEAFYFDNPYELIDSIAKFTFKGYSIAFLSYETRVSYDFKKGEIY